MRELGVLLVALLHCSGLACSQAQNLAAERDLQIIYKTFAQNRAAFDVFLELLPAPTESKLLSLYFAWLHSSHGQAQVEGIFASPRLSTDVLASILTAASANISRVPLAPVQAPAPAPLPPVSMDSSAAALFLPGYPAAPAAPAAQPTPGSDSAAAPAGQPSPSLEGAAASSGQPSQPAVTAPSSSAQVPAGSENAAAPSQEPSRAAAPSEQPDAASEGILPLPSTTQLNPKKGAGMYIFKHLNEALQSARLSWTYNWWYFMTPGTVLPPGTEYVPMIWRAADATPVNVAIAKQSTSGILLGFNEPNEKVQANNTVEQAIAAWPTLMASGLRLGSPAVSVVQDGTQLDSWLGQFMTQIDIFAYHVDFMCVHWYGNQTYFDDPVGATAALQAYLQAYHITYQRNVWLTEWALADFGDDTNNFSWTFPTYDQQVAFMQLAVPMLNSLSFVERYAWYFLSPDQIYDGQNGQALNTACLCFSNGSATPTGLAYQPS